MSWQSLGSTVLTDARSFCRTTLEFRGLDNKCPSLRTLVCPGLEPKVNPDELPLYWQKHWRWHCVTNEPRATSPGSVHTSCKRFET